MTELPGRPVCAHRAGARLRGEREGLPAEPDVERVVRDGLDRGVASKLESGGRHAAFRRPPAPPPRPDPARPFDPRLPLDQGPPRQRRRRRCSASGPRRRRSRRSTSSTGSTSRSTSSTSTYLKTLVSLDFGDSITSRQPVIEEFKQRFPATIELAIAAMFFSIFVGIPLGFLAAKRLRQRARPREPRRLAARDLDPDLLPRDHPQVRLRGAARLATDGRADVRPDRRSSIRRTSTSSTRSWPATWRPSGTCSSI